MAIVQISKIQHRSGNIDSLPQLDAAEFGLAVDYTSIPGTALNRLFIGPVVPVVSNSAPLANNIEILTQYSIISKISNGNSNVHIPVANGNITMGVAGNANVVVITGTGANIFGNAYVSGNIVIPSIGTNTQMLYNNNGNVGAAPNLGFDNSTGQFISNIGGARGDSSFSPATAPSGVPPYLVTSSVTVSNLFVDGAERANVQLASADANVYHLTFTSNGVETWAANAGAFTGDKRIYSNSQLTYSIGGGNTSTLTVGGAVNVATNINGTGTPNNFFTGNWVFPTGNSLYAGNITALQDPSYLNGNWAMQPGSSLTGGNATSPTFLSGRWELSPGATFQATYADLAEYYVADATYEPGTVLEFGGEHEVTLASDETTRVAGVVSTNPAYGMNANCEGEHVVALALQGRVPTKVRGNIRKGDMLCSGGDGYARPTHHPKMGTIIGKALVDFSGEGVIEIAVGRL